MQTAHKRAVSLWQGICRPSYDVFIEASKEVSEFQSEKLNEILSRNTESSFGKRYDFRSIRCLDEFRKRVPLSRYEDYSDSIEAIQKGQFSSLTEEVPLRFHQTSGSTSSQKLIPFTAGLKREFQGALRAWLYDLFIGCPEAFYGKSYWFLTPDFDASLHRESCIPIEYDSDENYFNLKERLLLQRLLLAPVTACVRDGEVDYTNLACSLLSQTQVSFLSLWNPSLFTVFLDWTQRHIEKVIVAIREGGDRERGRFLDRLFARDISDSERWQAVWPSLRLISCWNDGFAREDAALLQKMFPEVRIQGKGLLATEGVVSIPLTDREAPVLAAHTHFFEFEECTTKELFLSHELQCGKRYEVLITTSGGLYRYRLGDIVSVEGFFNHAPRLLFERKCSEFLDLRGEKLHEAFVEAMVAESLSHREARRPFWFLAPWKNSLRAGYSLFIESTSSESELRLLAERTEKRFCSNPHYALCRKLGQLEELEVIRLKPGGKEAYLHQKQMRGARSTLKERKLESLSIWKELLAPYLFDGVSV